MRDWNNPFSYRVISFLTVESLPMRDWNQKSCSARNAKATLRAYLWGIETNNLWTTAHPRPCVELRAYLWGIETRWSEGKTEREAGWEPTYEGLKHNIEKVINETIQVESLPMRDWNYSPSANSFASISLRAYLWGIETSKLCPCTFLQWELRAYLLGIETISFSILNRSSSSSLRAYLWGIETHF